MTTRHPITIIVPVYGDWPSLKDCIESLQAHANSSFHKIILVNDCGPKADYIESKIKAIIHGYENFEYYRNKKNLGFVQNCNNAVLKLDKTKNDILLLNSDTKITKGSLDEMSEVLHSKKSFGVVSPRSNNATLATIPLSSAPKRGIEKQESYKLFLRMKDSMPRTSITPTAHGFCMLIKRSLIKSYGLFDEVFGKGYGEEVDFCQRVRQAGYDCLLANRAYVFHQEARSFSLEAKAKMLEVNNQIIWERYPNYRQEVRDYMQEAVVSEQKIEDTVSRPKSRTILKTKLKHLAQRNKKAYALAQSARNRLRL